MTGFWATVRAAVAALFGSRNPGGVPAPTVPVPDNPVWTGATKPDPIPESDVVLALPKDMYRHDLAPSEWWWHIGTLRAGDRTFGFEINAASFIGQKFAMTQISLGDVEAGRHYQRTQVYGPAPLGVFDVATWAEGDPSKDWYARLGDPDWTVGGFSVTNRGSGYTKAPKVKIEGDGSGAAGVAILDRGEVTQIVLLRPGTGYTTPPAITLVGGGGSGATAVPVRNWASMTASKDDPTRIHVQAILVDTHSLDEVTFDLTVAQEGRPFWVWGTGIKPGGSTQDLTKDNYYFSYTRLKTSGTITVAGTEHHVTGTTWMDHEYGYFEGASPDRVMRWLLQDMQLDNGYSISNASIVTAGYKSELGVTRDAYATIQDPDGNLYHVASRITAIGELWTSPTTGNVYVQQWRVEIPSFHADLTATVRLQNQEFPTQNLAVYEGASSAEGTFLGATVAGDVWIEQVF